jgi:predicted RNA-binding protein
MSTLINRVSKLDNTQIINILGFDEVIIRAVRICNMTRWAKVLRGNLVKKINDGRIDEIELIIAENEL